MKVSEVSNVVRGKLNAADAGTPRLYLAVAAVVIVALVILLVLL